MSKVTINDLFDLKTIATPVYHPDGNQFLYVVNQINQTENNYYSNIYLYNCEKGETKEIIANQSLNTHPLWNRAGTAFLFLSNKTGKNQVYLYTFLTKTVKQLTEVSEGVQQVLWHTDDQHFFFGTKRTNNSVLKHEVKEHPNVFITESINYLENGKGLVSSDGQMSFA
ncbi:TolB family protein [Enterococcus rivorum]|uniref:TolB family protein n=1 Tax=Enterococcus rivorum TaxID=762845 RepID=UPI00362D2A61